MQKYLYRFRAMGTPMALNLLKKKYNLFLYDINTKNYKKFYKSKAKICNNYKTYQVKVMYLLVCFLMVKLYQI